MNRLTVPIFNLIVSSRWELLLKYRDHLLKLGKDSLRFIWMGKEKWKRAKIGSHLIREWVNMAKDSFWANRSTIQHLLILVEPLLLTMPKRKKIHSNLNSILQRWRIMIIIPIITTMVAVNFTWKTTFLIRWSTIATIFMAETISNKTTRNSDMAHFTKSSRTCNNSQMERMTITSMDMVDKSRWRMNRFNKVNPWECFRYPDLVQD